jgi:hypothetical protein
MMLLLREFVFIKHVFYLKKRKGFFFLIENQGKMEKVVKQVVFTDGTKKGWIQKRRELT